MTGNAADEEDLLSPKQKIAAWEFMMDMVLATGAVFVANKAKSVTESDISLEQAKDECKPVLDTIKAVLVSRELAGRLSPDDSNYRAVLGRDLSQMRRISISMMPPEWIADLRNKAAEEADKIIKHNRQE